MTLTTGASATVTLKLDGSTWIEQVPVERKKEEETKGGAALEKPGVAAGEKKEVEGEVTGVAKEVRREAKADKEAKATTEPEVKAKVESEVKAKVEPEKKVEADEAETKVEPGGAKTNKEKQKVVSLSVSATDTVEKHTEG